MSECNKIKSLADDLDLRLLSETFHVYDQKAVCHFDLIMVSFKTYDENGQHLSGVAGIVVLCPFKQSFLPPFLPYLNRDLLSSTMNFITSFRIRSIST